MVKSKRVKSSAFKSKIIKAAAGNICFLQPLIRIYFKIR